MTNCVLPEPSLFQKDGQPWTLLELAQYLKLSKKSLERAIVLGSLQCIRYGRLVRIADSEVRRVAEFGLCLPATTK